jgi:hypothetical protein
MLGIDNRGHRVRGCPSPQRSPRNGAPAAQAQRGAPSGERESDRACARLPFATIDRGGFCQVAVSATLCPKVSG